MQLNSRHNLTLFAFLIAFIVNQESLRAGYDSVTTTPGMDPNNNVIIAKDDNVTFQISATPFEGYVASNGYSWIFNNGTILAGDPTQAGPIVVTFGSAAKGNTNQCTVGLTHYGSEGELCQSPFIVLTTINVLVPQIVPKAIATVPANQARTIIGVGEEVLCSTQPPLPAGYSALWQTTNAGTINADTGDYTAGDITESEDITVDNSAGEQLDKITFAVKAPLGAPHYQITTDKLHVSGCPNAGFRATWVINPTNVSFYNVMFEEQMANWAASGYFFNCDNGKGHEPLAVWYGINNDNSSQVTDTNTSGYDSNQPTSNWAGLTEVMIPLDYRVNGHVHSAYYTEDEKASSSGAAGTCTISKNDGSSTSIASDPNAN